MEQTIDPLTNEPFVKLRRNMRFATPEHRIKWHSKNKLLAKELRAFIEKPLHVNHKILMELLEPSETKTFQKTILSEQGYCFSVLTHYEYHDNCLNAALYNFILLTFGTNEPFLTIYRKI